MILLQKKYASKTFDETTLKLITFSIPIEASLDVDEKDIDFDSEEEKEFYLASKKLILKVREKYPSNQYGLWLSPNLKITDFLSKPEEIR